MIKQLLLISSILWVPSLTHAKESTTDKAKNEWFLDQSPLIHAHQSLLEGDLATTFSSLVEVWQSLPAKYQEDNLNDLLNQVLTVDCGRSFFTTNLPSWITDLRFSMQRAYTFGRLSQHVAIYVTTTKPLAALTLDQWPESKLMDIKSIEPITIKTSTQDNTSVQQALYQYEVSKELVEAIQPGLYTVKFNFEDDSTWNSALLIGSANFSRSLVWHPDDTWSIQKLALLNSSCPPPELQVKIIPDNDATHLPVREESFTNNYPTRLKDYHLPDGKYLLELSLVNTRYQGDIKLDQTQKIIKNHAISLTNSQEFKQMFDKDMPNLTHEEQQKAVEKIQELMASGMSTGQAIQQVAKEIRQAQDDKTDDNN